MWIVNGKEICMTKGDYGINLPITINGITFGQNDEIRFTLKRKQDHCYNNSQPAHQVVLTKTYTDIQQNTINLELTKEETDKLNVGAYIYSLDWYQSDQFMCNLIPSASFKVVEKA